MYKTTNGWTKEQMIECITERMLDHKSANGPGECLYQAEDGNRCAAGVFIPDDMRVSENSSIATLLIQMPELRKVMPLDSIGMTLMQMCHDLDEISSQDPRPRLIEWVNKNVTNGDKA